MRHDSNRPVGNGLLTKHLANCDECKSWFNKLNSLAEMLEKSELKFDESRAAKFNFNKTKVIRIEEDLVANLHKSKNRVTFGHMSLIAAMLLITIGLLSLYMTEDFDRTLQDVSYSQAGFSMPLVEIENISVDRMARALVSPELDGAGKKINGVISWVKGFIPPEVAEKIILEKQRSEELDI